jgi:hypothetical protein
MSKIEPTHFELEPEEEKNAIRKRFSSPNGKKINLNSLK